MKDPHVYYVHLAGRALAAALLACGPYATSAQSYLGVGVDFGGLLRPGNWSEVYGPCFTTGIRIESGVGGGWLLTLEGDLLYGSEVRVDPLAGLRSSVGVLGDVGAEARRAEVVLKSRGLRVGALVGRRIALGEAGLGLRASVGPSYLQHHIRIQDDATLTTSNLRDDYKAGYDRRAGGWGASAELGLDYRQRSGRTVFFVTAQGLFARTQPLRSVQFDLQAQAPSPGTDVGVGLAIGLVTSLFDPASQREADDIYY